MILKCIISLSIFFLIFPEINSQNVCPECICPVEYDLICAKQEVSGRLRGFSSKCVMDCSNQCRKNKFVFEKKGRCGTRSSMDKPVEKATRPPWPTKRPNRILFG